MKVRELIEQLERYDENLDIDILVRMPKFEKNKIYMVDGQPIKYFWQNDKGEYLFSEEQKYTIINVPLENRSIIKEMPSPDPRRVSDVPDSFMKLNVIELDVGDFTVLAGEDFAREVYLTQVEPNLELGRNVFNCVKFPEQVRVISSHFMVEFAKHVNKHNEKQDVDGCVYLDKYFGYNNMFDGCKLNL